MSGNSAENGLRILASPIDIAFVVGGPVFVDLDEDGGNQAQQRVFVEEDPELDGAPLQLLLYRAAPSGLKCVNGGDGFRQGKNGEAFGQVLLEPCCQPRRAAVIEGD